MSVHVSMIAMPVDQLQNCPKGFQEFVSQYFSPQNIFGRECFAAFGTIYGSNGSRGVAPSHSVDLRQYSEGLDNDLTLHMWMEQAQSEGIIWRMQKSVPDGGRSGFELDD